MPDPKPKTGLSILHIWQEAGKIVFTKAHVEQAAATREAICKECPHLHPGTFAHCGVCGCLIHAKTRSLSSSCPVDKWPALLSEEEEWRLNQLLNKPKR
jgi:hypothetical protein